jgi:EmrB/QacA subfamily drug resistance transporter
VIAVRHRGLATVSIVGGTFTSVLASTILNVPIHDIARDLGVSIAATTLLVTTSSVAFATLLPLGGWLGSRFGRRNVYCIAVGALGLAGLVSMFAHHLALLVAMRIVQGAAAACIVPLVMTLLADFYEPERRVLALSAWAMANSLGQAMGPPLGGLLTSALTWRATFAPAPLVALLTCVAALRYIPADPGREVPLEWRGALGLTLGVLLLQIAVTAIPQLGIGSPVIAISAVAGTLLLIDFARTIRTAKEPFVSPQAFREPSYVGACAGVFAATLAMGSALLAIPLYLIQGRHFTTAAAGFVAFALPLAMALFAPLTSAVVRRYGDVAAVRAALGAHALGMAALALIVVRAQSIWAFAAFLLLVGAGLALTYTSTAVSATATAAGRYGSGVGLYNLTRIAGSAVGAALVAMVLSRDPAAFGEIFAIGAAILAGALAVTLYPTVGGLRMDRL